MPSPPFLTLTFLLRRRHAGESCQVKESGSLCPCPAGHANGCQHLALSLSRWRPNLRSCHPPLCALPNLSGHTLPSSHLPACPAAKEDITAGGSHDGPHNWHRSARAGCDSAPTNKAVAHSWGDVLQSPHQDLGPSRVGGAHGRSGHRRHLANPGSRVG